MACPPEGQDLCAIWAIIAGLVCLIVGRWLGAREDRQRPE
ncbi:hypothetical protein MTDSW087_04849 [Methylobacterium dankookense]|uniref:Uncharacterized protein n=1 Tax=Methylobacterium dankookense TaxID=560405 RepID=A0A564G539_9HYPH|nr:hypothetical protein IFDJLNFL_4080 [Methylobacterium dankookense]VUF15116.1 hypothetical protein MTDSW087_04849 [Methylobacterium dankookense]